MNPSTTADDRAAIEQTIQTYFDGLYEGDADKLASVFHPGSALSFDNKGQFTVWPLAEWLDKVRRRPSPQATGLARDDAILAFDQSGPTTAWVKVKCQIPPAYFTDYLNLVKTGGLWRVAQKVFASEVRG